MGGRADRELRGGQAAIHCKRSCRSRVMYAACCDSGHRHRLNHLDLVVPDGQPVRLGTELASRRRTKEPVRGPTLMLRLCEVAAARAVPIYLYGSRPEVLQVLQARLHVRFPRLDLRWCAAMRGFAH